jgi:hypothetical protein
MKATGIQQLVCDNRASGTKIADVRYGRGQKFLDRITGKHRLNFAPGTWLTRGCISQCNRGML